MTDHKHDTAREIELLDISIAAAEDRLANLRDERRQAVREDRIAEHVLQLGLPDEDLVEELHDRGIDYDTAEAIVRHHRSCCGGGGASASQEKV